MRGRERCAVNVRVSWGLHSGEGVVIMYDVLVMPDSNVMIIRSTDYSSISFHKCPSCSLSISLDLHFVLDLKIYNLSCACAGATSE